MTRYAKTLVALVPVLLAALNVVVEAMNDERVTTQEWLLVAIAALTAVGVYAVPNTPPAGHRADPRMSEQSQGLVVHEGVDPAHRQNTGDLGEAPVVLVLAIVGVVLLVLLLVGVL